jgi:8-oxo-dGTP diphosphatase
MGTERNCPNVSPDVIIFNENDELLLIKRGKDPFMGKYAFPGGHMEIGETAPECAARELYEETAIKIDPSKLQLVGVYSDPKRDPRTHNISLAYMGIVTGQVPIAADDAKEAMFVKDYMGLEMAFDHADILRDALRLKNDHSA